MRRGKPLARKTPLRAKTPLQARKPMKSKVTSTGPARDVVDAVGERAGHSCEICSAAVGPRRGVDHHIHHRRPRAAGGTSRPDTNLPSNLLLLCPGCHERVESRRALALELGWLVPQTADPAYIPVLIRHERWCYLTRAGGYSTHPPSIEEGDPMASARERAQQAAAEAKKPTPAQAEGASRRRDGLPPAHEGMPLSAEEWQLIEPDAGERQ